MPTLLFFFVLHVLHLTGVTEVKGEKLQTQVVYNAHSQRSPVGERHWMFRGREELYAY